MTRREEIFVAVSNLVKKKGQRMFSRRDVRNELGVTGHEWDMKYTAFFQGMIENPSEKAMKLVPEYRALFKRVSRGEYSLTPYGESLL